MASWKSHSWWWNSHTSPRNSKWLSENLEDMDQLVSEMLKLIEEEGDSFAKKAEMYYQKRPLLISYVKDLYCMYRALAERYDHATGDLAKNAPTEIQSLSSDNWSETSLEAASLSSLSSPRKSPEHNANHFKPHWRAAGFDFFLRSGRCYDNPRRGSDESSSESGSDSDYNKAIDACENSSRLEMTIIGLENKLRETRDKLQEYKKGPDEQSEHLLNPEILDSSSVEILPASSNKNFIAFEKQMETLQADLPDYKVEIRNLKEAMEAAGMQYKNEILSRDRIIKAYRAWLGAILNKSLQDKSLLEGESIITIAKDEQIAHLEIKTLEQEHSIRELKAMAAQFSKKLLQDKYMLETKLASFMASSNSYGVKLQVLEKRLRQLEAEKRKECAQNGKQIAELNRILDGVKLKVVVLTSEKDELEARVSELVKDIEARDQCLKELNLQNAKLSEEFEDARKYSVELKDRVRELDDEVSRQRVVIIDGAEGKREVIRQLCFSIEHYRIGYLNLCKRLQGRNKRPAIMAM